MSVLNGHPQTKIQNFSVETVRNILNLDNKGIAKLCARVSLMPKKDSHGRTYFTKDDVEILRRIKSLGEQQKTIKRSQEPLKASKSYASIPMKKASSKLQAVVSSKKEKEEKKVPQIVESSAAVAPVAAVIDKICSSLSSLENNLVAKVSKIVDDKVGAKLDEKLDGMDEVVVELVRCKTENETLRYKMNELNKEVYNLKNELSKYNHLGFGFYVKKNGDSSLL